MIYRELITYYRLRPELEAHYDRDAYALARTPDDEYTIPLYQVIWSARNEGGSMPIAVSHRADTIDEVKDLLLEAPEPQFTCPLCHEHAGYFMVNGAAGVCGSCERGVPFRQARLAYEATQ